jgi:hypothetical protein
MSLALQPPLGPEKTPPDIELRNSADLVDQLAFIARVLLFMPHRADFAFPLRHRISASTPGRFAIAPHSVGNEQSLERNALSGDKKNAALPL